MSLVKRGASGLALLDSLLVFYVFYAPGGGGMVSLEMTAVGVILLVDSGLCFYGVRYAFYASAGLSVLIIVVLVTSASPLSGLNLLVLLLSAACAAAGFLAGRSRSAMAEQGNPMNLPVFG